MPGIEIKGRSKTANYRHGRLVEPKEPKQSVNRRKSISEKIPFEHQRPSQKRKLKIKQTEMDSIK